MDLLFELLFEIIIEGSLEIGTSRKIPLPLRILALLVIVTIFGGIAILLFLCGYNALQERKTAAGILFLVVGLGIVIGSVYMVIKKVRMRR